MKNEVIGFESIKEMYGIDKDFWQVVAYLNKSITDNEDPYIYYFLQDGYLFKGQQFCIPDNSM